MSGTRGDLVLHPVALVGLGVLLLNDHVLKGAAPGWATGKLSDVAGLAFFPFLLLALVDVVRPRGRPGTTAALVAATVTAVVFVAVKVWAPARAAYAGVVGVLRFPLDTLISGATRPVAVVITPDVTDVVAVAACAAVVLVVMKEQSGRRVRNNPNGVVRAAQVLDH